MFFKILAFAAIATVANGQIQFTGKCQNVSTQQNFSISEYLGVWYEIEKYLTIFQNNGECVTATYTLLPNNTVEVKNSMTIKDAVVTITGTAREEFPLLKDGKLRVNFPSVGNYNATYWVLGTDYKNYSVVWSCTQLSAETNFQFLWILTRTPNITTADKTTVYNLIEKNGLNQSKLIKTNQTNCHHKHNSATNVGLSITLLSLTSTICLLTQILTKS